MQNSVVQPQVKMMASNQNSPANVTPQIQSNQGQNHGGNMSVPPNYSGVNIQIFNPSVSTPGSTTAYNVNAPSYGAPASQAKQPYYGPDYYTGYDNRGGISGRIDVNNSGCNCGEDSETVTTKTTKKNIIILTDEYIKNLESYLNSKDREMRLDAAKQVIDRFNEDESRKDDVALNILLDKMLQDPSPEIRALALSALESGIALGDNYAVDILKSMQDSKDAYGLDSLQASNILLKMSGRPGVKQVEVTETKKTTTKS